MSVKHSFTLNLKHVSHNCPDERRKARREHFERDTSPS